jgi:hypothetical protein
MEAFEVILHLVQALSLHANVRSRAIFLVHRLIDCAGERIAPYLPAALEMLLIHLEPAGGGGAGGADLSANDTGGGGNDDAKVLDANVAAGILHKAGLGSARQQYVTLNNINTILYIQCSDSHVH